MIKKPVSKRKSASPRKRTSPPARKKPASRKKLPTSGPDAPIGKVVAFFRIPVVAVIRLKQGGLKVGDRIWVKGHTTDLKLAVHSMQIDHQPILEIRKGQEAGIKVSGKVRRGDRVYQL